MQKTRFLTIHASETLKVGLIVRTKVLYQLSTVNCQLSTVNCQLF
ncbi:MULTISPECIES: hypothetical protein [unclassified Microcoleus]|nr:MULTISPECIES: hypothetical protein [unclassified Microcoleus]